MLLAANVGLATNFTWTNSASDVWQSTTAWNPAGSFPSALGDNAVFTNAGAYTVMLTSDVSNLGSNHVAGTVGTQVLTLNLGTNSLSVIGPTTSPGPFYVGSQAAGATGILYLSSSSNAGKGLFVTNSGNNARLVIGRNTSGNQMIVTNGNVTVNLIFLGSASGGAGSLVLSGTNTYLSSNGTVEFGSSSTSWGCSLVISNSASMTSAGAFKVGFATTASSESVLLDSGGRLFTTAGGTAIGATAVSTNNTATIQGGAVWDNGNKDFIVGAVSTATNNTLTIGTGSSLTNNSVVVISAGNSLNLQGGVLQTSGTTTNSGAIRGFGSIVGNAIVMSSALLTPGNSSSVGQINCSNNLTLAAGSTTLIKLDKSQLTSNDFVNVIGSLGYGGMLTVANVGPALTGGDTFKLFAFGSRSSSFTATNLPALDSSVHWDTSQLDAQGILSVLFVPVPPGIISLTNQAALAGVDVTISATVTGIPMPTLQWQKDGTNLVGDTSNSVFIPDAQIPVSGVYCLIASNIAGAVTNCMTLTVATNNVPPTITGPTDQIAIQGSNATFTINVSGLPTPTIQWRENGTNITGATGSSLILTNVQYAHDGFLYSAVASNSAGTATSSNATLTVYVPPSISAQPQSIVVTSGQSAAFSVSASGVPAPTYRWRKNGSPIANATNEAFTIGSAVPSDAANYSVTVSNAAGQVTSSNATLSVIAGFSYSLSPSNGATGVCYDTPLSITFSGPPVLTNAGKISIYNVTNTNTPVDTLDMSQNFNNSNSAGSTTNIAFNLQSRTIAGETFNTFPVIITDNRAAIYPHLGVLTSNQTYYVTVDYGVFSDTNGAPFVGITGANAWRFTTKPTGPAIPTNLVVAADGSGDFCTCQGAVDSVLANNTSYTLISIRNGTYTEIVNVRQKNNITFRGQSRAGTIVGYPNNANCAPSGSTHFRMAFKVNANDIALESLTLVNMTPKGGSQAEALMLETAIKRFIFFNAEVDSFQDTILGNTSGTQAYFQNCLVQGDVDYIWGGMNGFFTNCEIRTRTGNGNLIQPRTDQGSNGIAFLNCQFTRSSNTVAGVGLARALGFQYGNVIYINSRFDAATFTGWNAQDLSDFGSTLRWWEYGNSNLAGTASVTFNGTQLTNGDINVANASSASAWLYGWAPQLAPDITNQPVSLVVSTGQAATFSVGATGIPDPSFQWLKAGTNLASATSTTLSIPNAQLGDAGSYSVIVSNAAGSAISASAMLTVIAPPDPFAQWQLQYFGCTNCPQAAATADPDGDGMDNQSEFMAGTNPTNSASALRIILVARQANDVSITWTAGGGTTNLVLATTGSGNGNYATNFADISGPIVIPGSGDTTNSFLDVGGGTNATRYYRVRLTP